MIANVIMPQIQTAGRYQLRARAWKKESLPRRVLVIRLQATGDLVITLPYLQGLRKILPSSTQLDLLTREEAAPIPKSLQLFDHVYSIGGGRNGKKQALHLVTLLPSLLWRQYEVVIDLQNNIMSRMVRKIIRPVTWSEFDRYAAIPAGMCNHMAIEAAGFTNCSPLYQFSFQNDIDITKLLKDNGWDGKSSLVVLNPAGAFPTRNWPVERYAEFAHIWLDRFPATQFIVMGLNTISGKAAYLQRQLGRTLINLVNKTTPVEAFAMMKSVQFVLSEDSGLMHMAWVNAVPTLAVFGSTNSTRARPLGENSGLLHSADLSCGNCMLETCTHGDNRCLTRYSPSYVFETAVSLLSPEYSKLLMHDSYP